MCVLSLFCSNRAHLTQGAGERQSAQMARDKRAGVTRVTCEPCVPQSRFSRQSRLSRLSQASAMTLTAYQRCVIPTALAHRLGAS